MHGLIRHPAKGAARSGETISNKAEELKGAAKKKFGDVTDNGTFRLEALPGRTRPR
jgi:hypothetical protein